MKFSYYLVHTAPFFNSIFILNKIKKGNLMTTLWWPFQNVIPHWLKSLYHYENFRLYCKNFYVNMDCNWVCRDHFLYQYLPKIQLPKGNTGLQNLTLIFTKFVLTISLQAPTTKRRRPVNQNKQTLVKFSSPYQNVKILALATNLWKMVI